MIRKGYGYPSVFNTDEIIMEQLRTGKTLEDARQGGCSGCIETGCFVDLDRHHQEEIIARTGQDAF